MKKLFPKVPSGRLLIALLIAFTAFVVHSCRKSYETDDQLKMPMIGLSPIAIEKFKEIYDGGVKNGLSVQTAIPGQPILNLVQGLNVDWTTYIVTTRSDSSKVNEFDMLPDSSFFALKNPKDGDTVRYRNKTSVVFIESKIKSLSFFMKVIEDKNEPGYGASVINNIHYGHIPAKFTGHVFYYTLGRQFMNGYRYKNGRISGVIKILPAGSAQNGLQTQSEQKRVNLAETCLTYDVYGTWCGRNGHRDENGDIIWGHYYCVTEYMGSYTVCYTTGNDNPNPGGGGSGGGSGGGGATGDPHSPDPCPPAGGVQSSRGLVIQSINGRLKINLVDPGSGGGGSGGGTNPCDPIRNPNEEFEKDIDSARLADCVKKILYALEKGKPAAIADFISIFSGTTPGYRWRLEDATLDPNTNAQTDRIYDNGFIMHTKFDSEKFVDGSDLAIARTLLHESIHAYLRAFFLAEPALAQARYPELMDEWEKRGPNIAQHTEITKLLNNMTKLLKAYGESKHYLIDDQYYHDLTWGGLEDTKAFSDTSINKVSDQKRILNRLHVEQFGVDKLGVPGIKKGQPGGC